MTSWNATNCAGCPLNAVDACARVGRSEFPVQCGGCSGLVEVEVEASPSPPPPSPPSPTPPSPKPPCAAPIDFALVLDESYSMTRPAPFGSMEGPGGLKAFAKQLVSQYMLGEGMARFSVVSFQNDATTRVPWSYDMPEIEAGINAMTADGKTSISDGFLAARQLFANDSRVDATKVVLLISDGEQTVDAAPNKTAMETAVHEAAMVKGDGVTVFAWGFGDNRTTRVSMATLQDIATDPSKAYMARNFSGLMDNLAVLQSDLCNLSPPSPPPPSPPPPSPLPPPSPPPTLPPMTPPPTPPTTPPPPPPPRNCGCRCDIPSLSAHSTLQRACHTSRQSVTLRRCSGGGSC